MILYDRAIKYRNSRYPNIHSHINNSFFCELIDSSLVMGYGTTLTPLLMIIGFGPLAIVPVVLLSGLITGITAGMAHHKAGNVSFRRRSIHLKIALVLVTCITIGVVTAVFLATNIPKLWLKTYIGLIVLGMGFLILLTLKRLQVFLEEDNWSWINRSF